MWNTSHVCPKAQATIVVRLVHGHFVNLISKLLWSIFNVSCCVVELIFNCENGCWRLYTKTQHSTLNTSRWQGIEAKATLRLQQASYTYERGKIPTLQEAYCRQKVSLDFEEEALFMHLRASPPVLNMWPRPTEVHIWICFSIPCSMGMPKSQYPPNTSNFPKVREPFCNEIFNVQMNASWPSSWLYTSVFM